MILKYNCIQSANFVIDYNKKKNQKIKLFKSFLLKRKTYYRE